MVVVGYMPQEDHANIEDSLQSTSNTTTSFSNMKPEQEVHLYCKEKLKNRLFVGHYQERRYVDHLKTYRDVVVIHNSEVDLKRDLDITKGQLSNFYSDAMWLGYTDLVGSPDSHAVWVKLHDLPFGHYWFQIKQIIFGDNEIRLRLQVIRPLEMSDTTISRRDKQFSKSAAYLESNPSTMSQDTAFKESNTDILDSVPTLEECAYSLATYKDILVDKAAYYVVTVMTLHNLKETSRFLVALLVAVITGLVHVVKYTGDFSIKFMHEASGIIRSLTPIALSMIDFLTKMVGGLYILIAMMWRGQTGPQQYTAPHNNFQPQLQLEPKYSQSTRRTRPSSQTFNRSYSSLGSNKKLQ